MVITQVVYDIIVIRLRPSDGEPLGYLTSEVIVGIVFYVLLTQGTSHLTLVLNLLHQMTDRGDNLILYSCRLEFSTL